jgi:hypothetical protein
MEYFVLEEILHSPINIEKFYSVINDERDEPLLKTLTLVDKQKNGFGDMVYFIRDEKGLTDTVFEQDVQDYMRKKGVSSLTEGDSFVYRK